VDREDHRGISREFARTVESPLTRAGLVNQKFSLPRPNCSDCGDLVDTPWGHSFSKSPGMNPRCCHCHYRFHSSLACPRCATCSPAFPGRGIRQLCFIHLGGTWCGWVTVLHVPLDALGAEHAAVGRKLFPRFKTDDVVFPDLQLNSALLSTETTMRFNQLLGGADGFFFPTS
jgi:hypothetical protein